MTKKIEGLFCNRYNTFSLGFTLIELLIVISIIGLLSSVVLTSLNSARAKSRDAVRLSGIKQVATALELYLNSNGSYPDWVGSDLRENSCFSNGNSSDAVGQWDTVLAPLVTAGYLSSIPRDPLNTGTIGGSNNPDYCYAYHRKIDSVSLYDSCKDKTTGALLYPKDYEYLIYFSVENSSSARYTLNWLNITNPPENACFPGPHR